jgi:hypothetical protein
MSLQILIASFARAEVMRIDRISFPIACLVCVFGIIFKLLGLLMTTFKQWWQQLSEVLGSLSLWKL